MYSTCTYILRTKHASLYKTNCQRVNSLGSESETSTSFGNNLLSMNQKLTIQNLLDQGINSELALLERPPSVPLEIKPL